MSDPKSTYRWTVRLDANTQVVDMLNEVLLTV